MASSSDSYFSEYEDYKKYNPDVSGTTNAVTGAVSSVSPLWGAVYGIGSYFGDTVRGDDTSVGKNLYSDIFINPSYNLFHGLETGDWGAIERSKRAKQAKEREKNFDYKDTDAYMSAEQDANLAYRQMQSGLPEESMRYQEDMIGRTGAAALDRGGDLRQGVTGVTSASKTLTDSYRQLAALDAQQRIANRGTYFQSRDNLREQQAIDANIDYATYINNQAAILNNQAARSANMNNMMTEAMNAAKYIGNKGRTETEFGGWGWGQKDKQEPFSFGSGNNYGIPQGTQVNPFSGNDGDTPMTIPNDFG